MNEPNFRIVVIKGDGIGVDVTNEDMTNKHIGLIRLGARVPFMQHWIHTRAGQ